MACLVDEAAGEGGKFVDAAVAEERPPAAYVFAALHVDVDEVDTFTLGVGAEEEFALRTCYKIGCRWFVRWGRVRARHG